MLLRHSRSDAAGAVNVFCPRDVMPRLMSYSALSWSMKVSQEHPVPPHYAEPSRELVEFIATCECGAEVSDFSGGSGRVWRPMDGGGAGVCLSVGRKAAKSGSELVVSPLHMFHHTPTVGYVHVTVRPLSPSSNPLPQFRASCSRCSWITRRSLSLVLPSPSSHHAARACAVWSGTSLLRSASGCRRRCSFRATTRQPLATSRRRASVGRACPWRPTCRCSRSCATRRRRRCWTRRGSCSSAPRSWWSARTCTPTWTSRLCDEATPRGSARTASCTS
jgi:hypothetical protein